MLVAQESIKNKHILFLNIHRFELTIFIILFLILELTDFKTILKLISNVQPIFNLLKVIFLDYIHMNWLKARHTHHSFK